MAALSAGARGASLIEINPGRLTARRVPLQGNARERSPSLGSFRSTSRIPQASHRHTWTKAQCGGDLLGGFARGGRVVEAEVGIGAHGRSLFRLVRSGGDRTGGRR